MGPGWPVALRQFSGHAALFYRLLRANVATLSELPTLPLLNLPWPSPATVGWDDYWDEQSGEQSDDSEVETSSGDEGDSDDLESVVGESGVFCCTGHDEPFSLPPGWGPSKMIERYHDRATTLVLRKYHFHTDLTDLISPYGLRLASRQEMTSLFGTLLPSIGQMGWTTLVLEECTIDPYYLRVLFQAIETSRVVFPTLVLHGVPITHAIFKSIRLMLLAEARIQGLVIRDCGMGRRDCRLICDGAASNHHLTVLQLEGRFVAFSGTLSKAVGWDSRIQVFRVTILRWSTKAFNEFLSAVIQNRTLQEIEIICRRPIQITTHMLAKIEDMLSCRRTTMARFSIMTPDVHITYTEGALRARLWA
jgi:hypothetical protein